jgi:RNA polymerase sigma factor for flagellar operon FliA
MHRALRSYASSRATDSALLSRYSPMLDRHARRLAMRTGAFASIDDFWNAGAIGLIEAAKRYDPAAGVPFEGFVEHRVRGAMLDELRRLDHLPRRLRDQTDAIAKGRRKLGQQLGREPTVEELASDLNMDVAEMSGIDALAQPMVAVDPELPDAAGAIDDQLDRAKILTRLTEAMGTLNERLQTIMSLIYVEGLTYKEVAGILQVSEPRICQLHRDAVLKLRAAMGVGDDEDEDD